MSSVERLFRALMRVGVVAVLALAIWSPAVGAAPVAAPMSQTMLKVGSLSLVAEAGLFAAVVKGYFQEEGLSVEFIPFRTTAEMTPPLATGEIQFGSAPVDPSTFNAILRGIDLKIVGYNAIINQPDASAGWMVRQDLLDSGRYHDFADLRGMTIALTAPGGIGMMWVERVLARGGLTPNDVQLVFLPLPDQPAAYANRGIDAGFQVEPFITVAESQGVARAVASVGELYPGLVAMVQFMSPIIAQNPDVGRRFVTAYLRGQRDYYRAFVQGAGGKEEMMQILLQYTPIREPRLIERMATHRVEPNGEMDPRTLYELQDYFLRFGSQQQSVDLSRVIDSSYADYAVSRLGRITP